MKYITSICFLLTSGIAMAYDPPRDSIKTIILSQSDVAISCDGHRFIVKIPKLASLTESHLDEVIFESQSKAVCSAIMAQYDIQDETKISVQVYSRHNIDGVNLSPCFYNDEECSGTIRRYYKEYVSLVAGDMPLTATKIIPESFRESIEYWAGNECPPYLTCGD